MKGITMRERRVLQVIIESDDDFDMATADREFDTATADALVAAGRAKVTRQEIVEVDGEEWVHMLVEPTELGIAAMRLPIDGAS